MTAAAVTLEAQADQDYESTSVRERTLIPAYVRSSSADSRSSGTSSAAADLIDSAPLDVADVLSLPVSIAEPTSASPSFRALEQWEGQVSEVGDSWFGAKVHSVAARSEEYVEFDLDDIAPDDVGLVIPGGVFYWSVGYLIQPSGQRYRSSLIRFRRLPAWSESDMVEVGLRAQRLRSMIRT